MANASPGQGYVPEGSGKGKEPEQSVPKPAAISPFQAALMAVCDQFKETYNGEIGSSPMLDKMQAHGVPEHKTAAQPSNEAGPASLIESLGLIPNITTIIDSLHKRKIDRNEEMQALIAAEKALEDGTASSSKSVNPYKRRRIVSSELMSNTKYYMAKTPDSLHPALGELSLGTRSFRRRVTPTKVGNRSFDLVSSLASFNILTAEIIQYLHAREVLTLYSISRVFHATWNASELSFARIMASLVDPVAAVAFPWEIYRDYLVRNPKGYIDIDYTQPSWIRGRDIDKPEEWEKRVSSCQGVRLDAAENSAAAAPGIENAVTAKPGSRFCVGLAWVNMLTQRERQSRDILAYLARKGHRVPESTRWTLRKLWLVLDCSTNDDRAKLMATWSDHDLFLAQLFFIKLSMVLMDPYYGQGTTELKDLMLGQPTGLRCLWQLLRQKRFTDNVEELLRLQLMFGHEITPEEAQQKTVLGVPVALLGIVHTEGWGHGSKHLMQPDELVAIESLRRNLGLEQKVPQMMSWGRRDHRTGEHIVPRIEDIYMSDDELGPATRGIDGRAGNVPFEPNDWMPHHYMRAVFDTLSKDEQLAVIAVEEDELLKSQAWLPEDDLSDEDEDDPVDPGDDDIDDDDVEDLEDDGDAEDNGGDAEDDEDDLDDDGDDEYDSDEDGEDNDDDEDGGGAVNNPGFQITTVASSGAMPLSGPPLAAQGGPSLLQSTLVSVSNHFVTAPAPGGGPTASNNNNGNSGATVQQPGSQNQTTGNPQPQPSHNFGQFQLSLPHRGNSAKGSGTLGAAPGPGNAALSAWNETADDAEDDYDNNWIHGQETADFGIRARDGGFLVPRGTPSTRIRYRKPTTEPAMILCTAEQLKGSAPLPAGVQEAMDRRLADYSRVYEEWQARHGNAQAIMARAGAGEGSAAAATPCTTGAPHAAGQGCAGASMPAETPGSSTVAPAAPDDQQAGLQPSSPQGPATARPSVNDGRADGATGQSAAAEDPSASPQQDSSLADADYDPAAGLPDNMDMSIFTVAADAYHKRSRSTDPTLDNGKFTAPALPDLLEGKGHCTEAGVSKTCGPHDDQQHRKKEPFAVSPINGRGGDDDPWSTDSDDDVMSGYDADMADGEQADRERQKQKKKKQRTVQGLRSIVRQREPRVEVLDHLGHEWSFPHSGPDEADQPRRHVYEEFDPDQTPYEYRQY
ncbi:hypothetical protein MAPG_05342 [Magnaporthiopsis poae ATCC 64411]|uniref:Uncharacterized protein n=1 Tax=Magnaporthiopsis poae (strain ATCC 64411 / 73-15) TaxID=644358 RepID=A0A0C4DZ53_MAGP6|nr:hypothetical protein MAPG_05342 [Magnaporthiopsis poae ATCC 64411]